MPSLLLSPQIRTLQIWEYLHLCPVGILPLSLFLPLFFPFYLSVPLDLTVHSLFILLKPALRFLQLHVYSLCLSCLMSACTCVIFVSQCVFAWTAHVYTCACVCVFMHLCVFQHVSMTWLVQKVSLSLIRSPETGRLAPARPSTANGTSALRRAPRLVTWATFASNCELNLESNLEMSREVKWKWNCVPISWVDDSNPY